MTNLVYILLAAVCLFWILKTTKKFIKIVFIIGLAVLAITWMGVTI